MNHPAALAVIAAAATLSAGLAGGCDRAEAKPGDVLVFAGYTAGRDGFTRVIAEFRRHWKSKTGREIEVQTSYLGSGAQSRAVAAGFEADVVALSLEADVARIVKAGLITHDWKKGPGGGMITNSVVVFAVRPGNPKGVRGWADLVRPGVEILTPDPRMSGGAQWNVLAAYGAARRGKTTGFAGDQGARAYLAALSANVKVLDKGARESIIQFENGIGDVAITYESEVLAGRIRGRKTDFVLPDSTILIENPAAVVDVYVDHRGRRAAAEEFLTFLHSPAAQAIFAESGLRPTHPEIGAKSAGLYRRPADLFTVEEFGGWGKAAPEFSGPDGLYTKIAAGRKAE
jgi:sulfate transport system substrate-binding protein